MIVAQFAREAELAEALRALRAARIGPLETYTPAPLAEADTHSPIPAVILAAALLGAAASLALQTYSNTVAYPFRIGGRPEFAWPSFLPTVFENAVLVAIVAGFVAFMAINRLPRLYDPVDEAEAMRHASSDAWVVCLRSEDDALARRARAVLDRLGPARIEQVAP